MATSTQDRAVQVSWLLPSAAILSVVLVSTSLVTSGSLMPAAAIVALVVGAAIALERPLWMVYFAVASGGLSFAYFLGFERSLFGSLGGLNLDGLRLVGLAAGLTLAVVARGWWRGPAVVWQYALLILLAGASLVWSSSRNDGMRLAAKMLLPYVIFLALANSGLTYERIRRVKSLILGSGVVLAAVSIFQYLFDLAVWTGQIGVARFEGTAGGYAPTAAYMGTLSILAASQWIGGRGPKYLALAALFYSIVMLTLARTELAGVLLAIAVVSIAIGRIRYVVVAGVVATVLALTYQPLRQRMFRSESASFRDIATAPLTTVLNTQGREQLWPATILFWSRRPLLGNGVGSTAPYLDTINPGQSVPHNEYLRVLAELGVVGLAFFVLTYAIALRRSWRLARVTTDETRGEHLAALASLTFFLAVCVLDNGLDWYMALTVYVWALVGLSEATARLSRTAARNA